MNDDPLAASREWPGLPNPLGGAALPSLSVTADALRHAFAKHQNEPHEETFGRPLATALREWFAGHPHGELPRRLLAEAGGILFEGLSAALTAPRVMAYSVQGTRWWEMVAILDSGAMVPLLVGDAVTIRSHFFHHRSLWRRTPQALREGAAAYLVEANCPRNDAGLWLYPEPGHWREFDEKKRKVRYHYRFLSHEAFGFEAATPGSPRSLRPAA